eukprot:scaffold20989_cov108-Isochrysis_galbana.AAC.1
MSEPSEEGIAAVGVENWMQLTFLVQGRSSLFVGTEIIFANVDAGGLMGHPLSILDADSRSGKQFLELHGVVSTPLLIDAWSLVRTMIMRSLISCAM